jgi:hypothetical protein
VAAAAAAAPAAAAAGWGADVLNGLPNILTIKRDSGDKALAAQWLISV